MLGELRQVDFIWVNRDYSSLDWFLLLSSSCISSCSQAVHPAVHPTVYPAANQLNVWCSSWQLSPLLRVQLYMTSAPRTNSDTLTL